MIALIRLFWDGLITRCPRCHQGQMFAHGLTMRRDCPVCGLPFERSSGEITGGMGINITLTLAFILIGAVLIGFLPGIPFGPGLLLLLLFAIVFPIAFYRSSRGLWVSILYLTGDNAEPDDAGLSGSDDRAKVERANDVLADRNRRA